MQVIWSDHPANIEMIIKKVLTLYEYRNSKLQ